ncbi:folylpolyglutamate synthase [Epicoccum nigrum]|nr:folylpolyglutamate synthase [Epicoccum nigrum]
MARIQPGLERIAALLRGVEFPWRSIHVAGTNGKGSICHYASSMLVGKTVSVGKFTSPHLVDRWDCITIDGKRITEAKFNIVERHYQTVNERGNIGASPFEILTATAFTIFNDRKVKIGVVEVGMGGRLDCTNILNNQAVSVISKIARDHQGFLGNTLSEIASHKAGILRPGVPYVISRTNEIAVQTVIKDYAHEIGAGECLSFTSPEMQKLSELARWQRVADRLMPFQVENLQVAVLATMQALKELDGEKKPKATGKKDQPARGVDSVKPRDIAKILLLNAKTQMPGRQEMLHLTPVFRNAGERKNHVLVDGAHNPDAAVALDCVVQEKLRLGESPTRGRPESGWAVTWVLAMTEGKDAKQFLTTLLRPGDNVVTTTFGPVAGMPWVKPMDPIELLEIAKKAVPGITGMYVPEVGALRAVCTAKYLSNQMAIWAPIVVTGSLYLVGDLHRELRPRADKRWWIDDDPATAADRESILQIHGEERERVKLFLSPGSDAGKLQAELDAVHREAEKLKIEEEALSAAERLELEDQRFAALYVTPEQLADHLARAEQAKEALARNLQAAAELKQKRAIEATKKRERMEKRIERLERKRVKRDIEKKRQEERRRGIPTGTLAPLKITKFNTKRKTNDAESKRPFRVRTVHTDTPRPRGTD